MRAVEIQENSALDLSPDKILAQVELMTQDDVFRSSKRSIAFLKYVVTEAVNGSADQIKERTIGIEVFGRSSSYDTSLDHIVRTAATELRKRLAIYYGGERHRSELRIGLIPGSYVPMFTQPQLAGPSSSEVEATTDRQAFALGAPHVLLKPIADPATTQDWGASYARRWKTMSLLPLAASMALITVAFFAYRGTHKSAPEYVFWKPVLDTPGPVLLAVGDVPNGPPKLPDAEGNTTLSTPIPSAGPSETVPFADAMTIARVVGALEANQKKVLIRRESASSFSDLRQGAVVLIGVFNNEWSLRLTHPLRYSLALDPDHHLVYIKDARNPAARNWSWATNQPLDHISGVNSPKLEDYALISRIESSETGHVVVAIGGLYRYGTEAAGEFLTDPDLMQAITRQTQKIDARRTLQIVLGTTVTDGTPGPPQILAVSTE
jgi:hypothetical protein